MRRRGPGCSFTPCPHPPTPPSSLSFPTVMDPDMGGESSCSSDHKALMHRPLLFPSTQRELSLPGAALGTRRGGEGGAGGGEDDVQTDGWMARCGWGILAEAPEGGGGRQSRPGRGLKSEWHTVTWAEVIFETKVYTVWHYMNLDHRWCWR